MIGLSLLLILVCGQALASDVALVRCPRELCTLNCEHGQKTDDKGCFVCECLEDPCQMRPCPRGEKCVNNKKCAGNPCNELQYSCEAYGNSYPCAMPMCADFCPHGFSNNEYGCMTCKCAADSCQEHQCPDGHKCKEQTMPGQGPGGVTEYKPYCEPISDHMSFEEPNQVSPMSQLSELPPLCQLRKLGMDDPKLLSHYKLAEVQFKDRKADEVKCSEDGHSFEPMQCNAALKQCWCETDAGEIVEGSVGDGEGLQCVPHQTTQVVIVMVLQHQIPAIDVENLKSVVVAQINVWTDIGLEAIQITEIIPTNSQVTITFTLTSNEHVVYISERLRLMLIKEPQTMTYQESEMTVDPDKVSTKPISKPVSSGGLIEESPDSRCWFRKVWDDYKVWVIIGPVILLLLLVLLAVTIMRCYQKSASRQFQHRPISQFSENLSYSPEIYITGDKPALVDEKKEAEA